MSTIPVNGNWNFRNNFYALCPPWLTTGNAEKYMYTLQLCTDLLLDKTNQAIKIRMPGQGDVSQIPYLAFDRQLTQGIHETPQQFVVRLQNAFEEWNISGSSISVLQNVQAYLQGTQTGVTGTNPWLTIISGAYDTVTQWNQFYVDSPIGSIPVRTTIEPSNFNWDNSTNPWRAWLVMFQALVSTGMSGTSGQTSTAAAGSFQSPGHAGSATSKSGITYPQCWIPQTIGTPVNYPWLTLIDLSGLTPADVGKWITISGSSNAGNNGVFPIVQYISSSSVVIANPNGVTSDAGPLTWSVGAYPFIGPSPVWGASGITFGQGELVTPQVLYGYNLGGVWTPTLEASGATLSWGLDVPSSLIGSVRSLVKQWKSAGTYYPRIVVSFAGGDGTAGNEYSPNSSIGSGNPSAQFASYGSNVAGVWTPQGIITSQFDCYCQGTGSWQQCSVPNIT